MKLLKSIKLIGGALLFSSGVLMTSCDFLDIVPPEQVGMDSHRLLHADEVINTSDKPYSFWSICPKPKE